MRKHQKRGRKQTSQRGLPRTKDKEKGENNLCQKRVQKQIFLLSRKIAVHPRRNLIFLEIAMTVKIPKS